MSVRGMSSSGGGVTDHGALTGLADNDHPQYGIQNGYVDMSNISLAFDTGTRVLTITAAAGTIDFYAGGVLYQKTSPQTFQIPNTTALHHIYWDTAGSLTSTTTFSAAIISTYAYTANVYWNATTGAAVVVGRETHGREMDAVTHSYLHHVFGSQYVSGLGLVMNQSSGVLIGNGANNASAQMYSSGSGEIRDEDITLTIGANTNPVTLPVLYRSGASGPWVSTTNSGYFCLTTGSGRMAWNQDTGGTWGLTEAGNGDYVLMHIFATNDITNPLKAVMGQAVYSSVALARTGANAEIASLATGALPFQEFHAIGTVIFETRTAYANAVKAIIVATDSGAAYVDWRTDFATPGGTATSNHNSLAGLQGGTANEFYHLTAAQIEELSTLSSAQMASLTSTTVGAIPASALSGITSAQLANLTPTAIGGLTSTQMAALSADAMKGLMSHALPFVAEKVGIDSSTALGSAAINHPYLASGQIEMFLGTPGSSGANAWNLQGDGGATAFSSSLAVGESRTFALGVKNGTSAQTRYLNSVQIDGATAGITAYWQGGSAPTSGNSGALDVYTGVILHTGTSTWLACLAQTKFA